MNKFFLSTGIVLSAIAILLGAFGAHGLKQIVTSNVIDLVKPGVQYQLYHSFALLFVGILFEKFNTKILKLSGVAFIIGIILFSGSLYTIAVLKATGIPIPTAIAILTPMGGSAFIMGWIFLLAAICK